MANNDFFRYHQFVIDQRHAAMKVGTDSDLLGALSATGNRILDIGTGTGVLSLIHAQRSPKAKITAIEIDEKAIIDAKTNFSTSPFASRIELIHASFQEYCQTASEGQFDTIVCNPPYFQDSLECPDKSRTLARHSSSLPFDVLAEGAYRLLGKEGYFSVCIPASVLDSFISECCFKGFWLQELYCIKSVPSKDPVLFILIHKKGHITHFAKHEFCMRNEDRSNSDWYKSITRDYHES